MRKFSFVLPAVLLLMAMGACNSDVHDDHDHHGHNHDPNEVMTTVKMTFTPNGGGESFVVQWADPENDGSPVIDDIVLTKGETYTVDLEVWNELESPAENVTPEIKDEMDEHQFFIYGTSVDGPGSETSSALVKHSYADKDSKGFVIGLSNTIEAVAAGEGSVYVMLRHMPPVNGVAVKTGELAAGFKASGETSLPGSADINVDFKLMVK